MRKLVISVTVLGVCLSVTNAPLYAQSQAWATPTQLTTVWMIGSFPDVATDPAGITHVVWSSGDEDFDTVMYKSTVDGNSWSETNDIFAFRHNPGESYVTRPVLSINRQGDIYLGIHGVQDRQYLASTAYDVAAMPYAWRDLQMDTSGYHVIPLATDDGRVHVLYTSSSETNRVQRALHLFYTQLDENSLTWTDPVDITLTSYLGTAKPTLLLDNRQVLHAIWESGLDGDRGYVVEPVSIMYANSRDQGSNWTKPIRLDVKVDEDSLIEGRNPAIAVDGAGRLIATWWGMPSNQVYFRTSVDQGQTWSQPQPIPGVWGVGGSSTTRQDGFSMATDSSGKVHLVMVGRRASEQPTVDVLHLEWNGAGWSLPATVASYNHNSQLPEWPRISIGLGNHLHVVWHVRYASEDGVVPTDTSFQIWYNHRIVDSPRIEPEILPVSSISPPQAPPTPLPIPAPTLPTSKFLPVQIDSLHREPPATSLLIPSIRTENDEVILLAIANLPVVIAVILVLSIVITLRVNFRSKMLRKR